jgi:hypothetical protein
MPNSPAAQSVANALGRKTARTRSAKAAVIADEITHGEFHLAQLWPTTALSRVESFVSHVRKSSVSEN